MKEINEFYCHNCGGYIAVELDMGLNGNHVIDCPKCHHEHCRVIEGGKITADRWDNRNGMQTYNYSTSMTNYSQTSIYCSSLGASSYLTDSWYNSTSNGTAATSTAYY